MTSLSLSFRNGGYVAPDCVLFELGTEESILTGSINTSTIDGWADDDAPISL